MQPPGWWFDRARAHGHLVISSFSFSLSSQPQQPRKPVWRLVKPWTGIMAGRLAAALLLVALTHAGDPAGSQTRAAAAAAQCVVCCCLPRRAPPPPPRTDDTSSCRAMPNPPAGWAAAQIAEGQTGLEHPAPAPIPVPESEPCYPGAVVTPAQGCRPWRCRQGSRQLPGLQSPAQLICATAAKLQGPTSRLQTAQTAPAGGARPTAAAPAPLP